MTYVVKPGRRVDKFWSVGTPKRERQKANRAQKLEEQRKQEQRDLTKDRGLIIGLIAVAVVAALGLWFFFGQDDADSEPTEVVTEEPAVPEQPLPTVANDPAPEESDSADDETTADETTDDESPESTEAE